MSNKIKLARYRSYPYTVNCPVTNKKWKWAGSINKKIDSKSIPEETYNWLVMETSAIKNGQLVVVDEKAKKELKDAMLDEDIKEIESNTHTREEVEKILKGNTNTMKSKLKDITSKDEKRFIINVAKEMKLDSTTKRSFLQEWVGHEIVFD